MATTNYLDFDGVLCDSVHECFFSSYLAYKDLPVNKKNLSLSTEIDNLKPLFFTYRPFVRSGEDYVLVQELMEKKQVIKNQEEFDEIILREGPTRMNIRKDKLYKVRDELLSNFPKTWLDQNPLFPGLQNPLKKIAKKYNTHILSTKKPQFIHQILKHWEINWAMERIHYATSSISKTEIILKQGHPTESLLIDDHPGHLSQAKESGITVRLAGWGYLDAKKQYNELQMWNLNEFIEFLNNETMVIN